MRRIIMKTLFYIIQKKLNKKGLLPIYCRITVNGRRCEISTGIWINPNQWGNECLDETNSDNMPINSALTKIKNDIQGLYYELIYKEKSVSAEIIKNLYTGTTIKNYTFLKLMEEYIEYKQQNISEYNTLKSYRCRKALIIEFLEHSKQKMLYPEDFTLKVADQFHYSI